MVKVEFALVLAVTVVMLSALGFLVVSIPSDREAKQPPDACREASIALRTDRNTETRLFTCNGHGTWRGGENHRRLRFFEPDSVCVILHSAASSMA